jgi:trehalose/maltose hydrolase-like predicted phosphorylase
MELKITAWQIEATDDSPAAKDFRESIFSQANGYMGIRGFAPEDRKENTYSRTTFLAGFYEYIRPGITDIVNQPDVTLTNLTINGIDISLLKKTSFSQTLDMRDGSLRWNYTVTDDQGRKTKVSVTRFLSMVRRHVAAFRFEIMPVNYDGTIEINSEIDTTIENLPISDNQLNENMETARIWSEPEDNKNAIYIETAYSKRGTAVEYRIITNTAKTCKQGEIVIFDKIAAIYCYRDGDDPREMAKREADEAAASGYEALFNENRAEWEKIWQAADIELAADMELQGAVRYNIFQLIQAAPYNDPGASIGARGLSHGRYKGCVFWDTEIFMLPFYQYTDPATAKNLLLYRYNTLNDAIESAKRFSLSGARYSWMSSDTGFEQCETWDTGCCEIHITADIAYAFGRYVELTDDKEFFIKHAAEVYLQTARYWASRFTYHAASDRYHLLFVKGPDEYCGVTGNNYFTVKMAKHNLKLALDAINRMENDFIAEWHELQKKIGYREIEQGLWRDIIKKTVVRYDQNLNLYLQDDTFHLLEPLDPAAHKDDDVPLYHKLSFDRLQRYQVLKQADIVMLMALFPDDYTKNQKQAAWEYYEPKTLHDSTLSFGAHALLAAQLGLDGKAETYLKKSCFLDLKNVMKNTAGEGLHIAAHGATWQALVFGYAGLWADADGLRCNPKLPDWIRGMRFCVYHKGQLNQISIKKGKEGVSQFFIETYTNK